MQYALDRFGFEAPPVARLLLTLHAHVIGDGLILGDLRRQVYVYFIALKSYYKK